MARRFLAAWVLFAAIGCGHAPAVPVDAAAHDAAVVDAVTDDAATMDAADLDAAVNDAAIDDGAIEMDASADDASDGEIDDAAPSDAELADAPDALPVDAGPIDGGILRTSDPPTHPAATPIAPFVLCTVTTSTDAISGAEHHAPCDVIDYPYHPPSSGPHYWEWAAFQNYSAPVPWGFLVHAMEHGAVILVYHCERDADCDPVRSEMASLVMDRGLDPVCRDEDTPQRIIIVPDPTLTVPIAAVAWGHVYTATCLDPPSLRAFVDAHYAMAPENFCFPGYDHSAEGWCP
jgi:hypothetical protein